jgi:uncharacterized iron-regulated membrane protein
MHTPDLPPAQPAPATPAPSVHSSIVALQQEVISLRILVNLVLLILLLAGFAGVGVMLKKVGRVRQQIEASQPQVDKMSADYDTVFKPRVSALLQSLVQYAQTDPNFVNVLRKYPIQQQAAPAPVGSPVPQPQVK